jgi:hypothetical protein
MHPKTIFFVAFLVFIAKNLSSQEWDGQGTQFNAESILRNQIVYCPHLPRQLLWANSAISRLVRLPARHRSISRCINSTGGTCPGAYR